MTELRRCAKKVARRLAMGEPLILTYRGKAVAQLEPIGELPAGDPIYSLADLATEGLPSTSNEEIDRLVYDE